jgi:flagellar protein FliL
MATGPKPVPKVVPAEETPAAAAAPKKGKKKTLLLVSIALLVLGGGGAAAWYFMGSDEAHEAAAPARKAEPIKPPVFVAIEPFTVNLQQESGDQFLQVAFTLQVPDQTQVELMKLYMPLLRSRVLLLLSGKKASELSTVDGKKKLQEEIIAQAKLPFIAHGGPQTVNGVFFTSFVIQ